MPCVGVGLNNFLVDMLLVMGGSVLGVLCLWVWL